MPRAYNPNYLNSQLNRYRKRMSRRAQGGLGYSARSGQTIRGALGRGAGGRFARVAGQETLAERNARLREILARVQALLRTPGPGAEGGGGRAPRGPKKLNVAQQLATNRAAFVEWVIGKGLLPRAAAQAFLDFLDDEPLDDAARRVLMQADLLDEAGADREAGLQHGTGQVRQGDEDQGRRAGSVPL